ncbi:MAG: PPIC-type domain protein [Haloplasmataceae bacterium]|nr:PPIC-type domain protein [Haloplasmataceae bacterium]
MRKFYLLCSVIITLTVLVGCGKKSKLPVITLEANEVTIDVNELYDLKTGVTAVDKKKNDLTEKIVIDSGEFNSLYEGNYEITYTVADKDGKVGTGTRVIHVVDKLRNQNVPVLTNPDGVVLEYNESKLTNNQLYIKLKEIVGTQTLIEIIDFELFKDNEIDDEKFNEYYDEMFEYYGETEFLKLLSRLGYYQNETENLDQFYVRLKEYLSLPFLKTEAVKQSELSKLTTEEVTNAMTSYREDLCVINLVYNTKAEATSALTLISASTGEKVDYFKTNYVSKETLIEDSYLSDQLNCEYERVIYNNQTNATYRDNLFNNVNVGEYTLEPVVNNSKFYLTYVVGIALAKEGYDQTEFETEIKDNLVNKKLSSDYINQKINAIRLEKGLKIYDPLLASQYKATDSNFSGVSELTDQKVIASFNGQNITTDEFYETLKNRFGAPELLTKINYQALMTIEEIKLSDEEMMAIKSQLSQIKSQYELSYSSMLKYTDFLIKNLGVINDKELIQLIELNTLSTRYLLGHNDYPGQEQITKEEIETEFANYFNVKASHILFTFDDEASKQEAYLKAMQVINGVEANETAHIILNNQNFVGLTHLTSEQLLTTFGELALKYSEDTGSKVQNGDLGYYKPGDMVKPFEDATRELVKDGRVGSFSTTPVESDFGYHVIIITDIKTPVKPNNYDLLTEAEITEIIKNNSDQAVINYHKVVEEIKSNLETSRLTYDNIEKSLASLRSSLDLKINDTNVLKHYEKLNELSIIE